MDVGTIAGWVCEAYQPRRRGHYMAEIMAPGEQAGGWVVRFRDTGRYYVNDEVGDTDDLGRAVTYVTQAEARGVAAHIKQSWVDPGPLDVVSLTAASVETLTGRTRGDPPMQQLKPSGDPDQRTLPTELEHLLRVSMPPGNLTAGGFEGQLVQLFADADPWNFVRLAQGFPLHGVAMLLWDAGLIHAKPLGGREWVPTPKLVDDGALWTCLKRPDKTWRQKFDATRFILNSPRTSSQGRQVSLLEVDHGR
jgi:hypothetical protein